MAPHSTVLFNLYLAYKLSGNSNSINRLRMGPRIYISNKLSDDGDISGPRTHTEYRWSRTTMFNLLTFP